MRQGELVFRSGGGARVGAGRKPKGERAGVPHRVRAALASRFPVHVTLKLRDGLPGLRRGAERKVVFEAFAKGCEREGFRVTHFSLLDDHVHLIAEGRDRGMLAAGLKGLAVRIARALNRLWERTGSVFGDRYHDRILRTPREVRNALRYVLQNCKRHGEGQMEPMDRFSSGPWFDGWRGEVTIRGRERFATPVAAPRTWLLNVGWRRHGLLTFEEIPAGGLSRRRR